MKKQIMSRLQSVIIVGAVLVMAICSLSMLNRSIAWISQSFAVRANGMDVSLSQEGATVSLTAHPVSQINQSTQTYTIVGDVEKYELPLHDPNGITYSEYKRALVVVIDIYCTESADIDVYLTSSTANVTLDADNFISNCIEVAPATLSGDKSTATVDGEFKSLVTVTGDSCTKDTSVLLQSLTIPSGESTLCFIIRYKEDFLTYASDTLIAADSDYLTIDYKNDITFSIE